MQLEENKEHLYIQDHQINKMNEKIKEVIGIKLEEDESINFQKIENENLSIFFFININ